MFEICGSGLPAPVCYEWCPLSRIPLATPDTAGGVEPGGGAVGVDPGRGAGVKGGEGG